MREIKDCVSGLSEDNKLIRFLLVGGLNTIFGYCTFAFFIFIGTHYSLAVLLTTIFGVLFNFRTTGKLVFKNSDKRLFFKFIGVYGTLYVINVGILKVFSHFTVNMYLAGALLVLPMALLGFFLNKKFVFEGKK